VGYKIDLVINKAEGIELTWSHCKVQ